MAALDYTHDARLHSWVEAANDPTCDFPIQNLPLGVFSVTTQSDARIGTAIGDQIIDLTGLADENLPPALHPLKAALKTKSLNALMCLGLDVTQSLRRTLFDGLVRHAENAAVLRRYLVPMHDVQMQLPAEIGDFTDFYTSEHHAVRAGQIVRPDAKLHPNFLSMPIAYHGRASSVAVSGTPCVRPHGQTQRAAGLYLPTAQLDFELEVGAYVGRGNSLGKPIALDAAKDHIFGICLANDWSARDLQRWESTPLGPFLAKSFLTSVSPWIITSEALAPFRVPVRVRDGVPEALSSPAHSAEGAIDLTLEVALQTASMRAKGLPPAVIARTNFRHQTWTLSQMLTHHASNGCNLRTGDLLSSGTVSGARMEEAGCLLERTQGGQNPLTLPDGEARDWLADGDLVVMRASCEQDGFARIGFGSCEGTVTSAREP